MSTDFPTDFKHVLVIVAHPDDPEYGLGPLVHHWTSAGRLVTYVMVTDGEAGIEGMAPAEAGPLRRDEQIRAAAQVGVDNVDFLGLPDGQLLNNPALPQAIADVLRRYPAASLVVTLYSGPEWEPGAPNHDDHIAVGEAVAAAARGRWVFEMGPGATHQLTVNEEDVERAVDSLAEHETYLRVLDPSTPVAAQARETVYRSISRDANNGFQLGLRLIHEPS